MEKIFTLHLQMSHISVCKCVFSVCVCMCVSVCVCVERCLVVAPTCVVDRGREKEGTCDHPPACGPL